MRRSAYLRAAPARYTCHVSRGDIFTRAARRAVHVCFIGTPARFGYDARRPRAHVAARYGTRAAEPHTVTQ